MRAVGMACGSSGSRAGSDGMELAQGCVQWWALVFHGVELWWSVVGELVNGAA